MKSKFTTIAIIAFLSSLLWVFISLSDDYFTTIELPVKFVDLPIKNAVGSSNVQKVTMSLKGQGWQLANLAFGRSPVFNISPSYKPGKHTFNLRNSIDINSWITSNMQVTEIQPDVITYTVESIMSKEVLVKPDINLSYKDGYGLVSEITLSNDTVKITGAKTILEHIDYVETKPYNFLNLERGVSAQVELKEIQGVSLSHNNCNIDFDVQKIVDKTFDEVIVNIENVPIQRELLLFPNKISIIIRGGINVLGQLDSDAVSAKIDFNQALTDTTGRLIPLIKIPENTSLVDIKPNSLGYIIKQY